MDNGGDRIARGKTIEQTRKCRVIYIRKYGVTVFMEMLAEVTK
jgi:hypothetical protein